MHRYIVILYHANQTLINYCIEYRVVNEEVKGKYNCEIKIPNVYLLNAYNLSEMTQLY